MSLKTSLYSFFAFLSLAVSFFAYSDDVYLVTSLNSASTASCGVPVSSGQYVTYSTMDNFCLGGTFKDSYGTHDITNSGVTSSNAEWKVWTGATGSGRSHLIAYVTKQSYSCLDSQLVNGDTGQCEEKPPICEDGQTYNPDSGLCEDPPPFCELSSTQNEIFTAEQSCADSGGVFQYQCHNGNELTEPSLETTCNEPPSACVMGFPNWPDCLGDYDPTSPIDPPDGGFTSPGDSTESTPGSGFDKPEPDDVTPTDSTDTAVLEAIQNMNRDNNQALGQINKDINQNSADIKNKLTDIRNSTNAVGQSIIDQMNQDYQIAEQNRLLQLQQNSTIANIGDDISSSVDAAAGQITTTLQAQTIALQDSIGGLGESICDPRTDPFNCEGSHGLDGQKATLLINNVTAIADDYADIAYDRAVSSAQGFIDNPRTQEVRGVIESSISDVLSVLPSNNSCVAFSLPSMFGEVSFSCEFSEKFKQLVSFLLYVYTAFTLIDILLSGVTPVAGTVPYGSRR